MSRRGWRGHSRRYPGGVARQGPHWTRTRYTVSSTSGKNEKTTTFQPLAADSSMISSRRRILADSVVGWSANAARRIAMKFQPAPQAFATVRGGRGRGAERFPRWTCRPARHRQGPASSHPGLRHFPRNVLRDVGPPRRLKPLTGPEWQKLERGAPLWTMTASTTHRNARPPRGVVVSTRAP